MRKISKAIALVMAMVMVFTGIPMTAFAAQEPVYLSERDINDELIEDGAFYIASSSAELAENSEGTYLLKIARKGSADSSKAVKLTMLDVTAKFGTDYSAKVYKSSLFEADVETSEDSLSIKDFISSADGLEYNYSDAIIDGSITSEDQLTEEEDAEETEKLVETLEENKDEINSVLLTSLKASPSETVKKNQSLSLSEAKELMTGIKDDKTAMEYSEDSGLFGQSTLLDTDLGDVDPYLLNGKKNVGEALSSAYVYVNFPKGVSERYIEISPINNEISEGNRQAEFSLESYEGSLISKDYADFTLIIADDEEYVPDTVEFSDTQYFPANGYVTVTVTRSGNCNEMAYVMLDSEDITATVGLNYSAVHAKVFFTYGTKTRTVKIPIRTYGLTENGEFLLKLQDNAGCVIGEKNEAVCTIRPDDESFEVKESGLGNSEAEDNSKIIADSDENDTLSNEQQLLGAEPKNDSSILLDQNFDLSKPLGPYAHYKGSSGMSGSAYKLRADCRLTRIGWAGATFSQGDIHYDWNGWQIEWEKTSAKPCSGITEIDYYDVNTKQWPAIFQKGDARWGKRIDNFFVASQSLLKLSIHTQKKSIRANEVKIYRISPIKRIFDVKLVGSNAVELIDENGKKQPNTQIEACSYYNRTWLENAVNQVLTVTSGDSISVKLSDLNPKVYIRSLKIVNLQTKESAVIQTYPEGQRNACITLTNDLIRNNLKYVSFGKNGAVGGLKGSFGIQAEVASMPSKIKVKDDTRYQISLWDGNGGTKTGKQENGYTVYQFNSGDCIRYTLELNAGYKGAWEWTQLNVKTLLPVKKDQDAWRKQEGKNYTTKQIIATETELSAELTSVKNRLTVMVPNDRLDLFDTEKGIFLKDKNPVKDNIYTYFNIDEGAGVNGTKYELQAFVKDSSYIPVWQEKYKNEKYSQSVYYYEAAAGADSNFIILSAGKADAVTFSAKGRMYYEDTVIGASTSSSAWYPAGGIGILLDQEHFGFSDNGGNYETLNFPGISGCFVKFKVLYSGGEQYKVIRLSNGEKKTIPVPGKEGKETITVNSINMENTVLRAIDVTHPHITAAHAYSPENADSANVMICQQGDVRMTRLTAYVETVDPNTGKEYEQTYSYQGKKITETEKPVEVQFIVLDPVTKKQKSVYTTKDTENNDGKTFTYSANFQTGNYNSYQAGDLVFVKLVTNRKTVVNDGTKEVLREVFETAPLNTGLSFTENLSSNPQRVNFNFPTDGVVELPFIGNLSMITDALGLSFGVTPTPSQGVRMFFGIGYNWKNSHFDGNGKETSDTGYEYGLSDFTKGWGDMKDMLKKMGTKNALGQQALGIPAWSFKPYAGVYFEFAIYRDSKGVVDKRFLFTGGGGYIGASASFRYTYYMLIIGIPVYVGGDVNLTMTAEFGIAPNKGANYALNDPTQDFFDDLIKNSHFDFIFRATATGNAYAGIGICGTLGLRGGFSLTLYFINNPTIKKKYSDMRTTGFAVSGQLKFWIDAVLLTIPKAAKTWDWAKFGYFEDLDKKKKNNDSQTLLGNGSEEGEPALLDGDAQIIQKPRQEEESIFVANESDTEELLGSGYVRFSEKTIEENSFDQPDEKLITYRTSDGDEKMLMVYLKDDKTRSANARTALMYTVYDSVTQNWTTPKAVDPMNQNAAFSPALVYLKKEDQILISWISRKEALPEKQDYSAYLSTTQVYTARFDVNAKDDPISQVTCMTNDNYLNANPKMIYDVSTGNVLLSYLKSEVPEGITTSDELLKAAMPQYNKAELAYLLYDGSSKKWVTDRYFAGELADASKEQLLLSAFGGQRFISSKISDFTVGGKTYTINNPVISDYDTGNAMIYTLSLSEAASQFESEATPEERAGWNDPVTGEDNYNSFMQQRADRIDKKIKDSEQPRGVLAFVADADNNLDTDGDKEIFIQLYDYEKHSFTAPVRLTDNTTAESNLQLVDDGDGTYLFWVEREATGSSIQDGTALLKYFNLADYTSDAAQNAENIHIADIQISDSDDTPTFSSYQAFSDAEGNLTVAWQETRKISTKEEEEEEEATIYSNSMYLAGLYDTEETQASKDKADFYWSDAILIEYKDGLQPKIFDSLQFTSFDEDQLLMVSNQYKLTDADDSYNISDSKLTMTAYKTASAVSLESVIEQSNFDSEGSTAVYMSLILRNGGVRSAKGFDYTVTLLTENEEVVGTFTRRCDDILQAGASTELPANVSLTRDITHKELASLLVNVEVAEDGTTEPTNETLPLCENTAYIEFGDLNLEQVGEDFELYGSIIIDPEDELRLEGNELLSFYQTENKPIETLSVKEIIKAADDSKDHQPGGEYTFNLTIPLSKLKLNYGFEDLTVVVEKEGKSCSETVAVRGYYDNPVKLLLNGKDTKALNLRVGEKMELNGSYSPADYYTNATMLYSVEDETIADLRGNILYAEKPGQTVLKMSTDPYGGTKDVTVIVRENTDDDDDDSGSSSGSVTRSGPLSAKALFGYWNQDSEGNWYFIETSGSKAVGWGYTGSGSNKEYYHFNEQGVMDSGWFMDTDGAWYYLHESHDGRFGAMDRGWHKDASDGKWYYLDLSNGKMKTGWINVGGYLYYLCSYVNEPAWIQDEKKRWIYTGKNKRSYGSMYENETTPDGHFVDQLGRRVK